MLDCTKLIQSHFFKTWKKQVPLTFIDTNIDLVGNVGKVVYDNKPLPKSTPVDLGNRQMTIGASQLRQ